MKPISNQKVVIIFGAPGSGKGTQARLISEKFGLYNFDTGKILESIWHDPKRQRDPVIRREKILFDTGKLNTPSVVLELVRNKVAKLAKDNMGMVFSGSPRTYFEAFGDKKNKGLIKTIEEYYGKKNIIFLSLDVSEQDSIKRNSNRMICSVCGTQLLSIFKIKFPACPFCGGKLRKRVLDDLKVIKVRLKEFRERTTPIFSGVKKMGYKINKINGTTIPYKVFESICHKL